MMGIRRRRRRPEPMLPSDSTSGHPRKSSAAAAGLEVPFREKKQSSRLCKAVKGNGNFMRVGDLLYFQMTRRRHPPSPPVPSVFGTKWSAP